MKRAVAIAAAVLAAGVVFAEKGPKLRQTDPLQPFWFGFRKAVINDKYAELKERTQFPFETLTPEGAPAAIHNKRQFDILFPTLSAVDVGKRSMRDLVEATENLPAAQWDDAADGEFRFGNFVFEKVKGQWFFVRAYTGPAAKTKGGRAKTTGADEAAPPSYDHSVLTSPSAPSILSKPAGRPAPPPEEEPEEAPAPPPPPKPKKVPAAKPIPPPEPAVPAPVTPEERPAAPPSKAPSSEEVGGTTSPAAKSVLPRPTAGGQTTVKTIKAPPPPKAEPPGGIEPEVPEVPAEPAEDLAHFRGYWYAFRGAVLSGNDAKIKTLTKFSFETKGDTDAARVKKHNAQEFDLLWGRLLQADPQTGPLRDSMREFIFRRADLTVEELSMENKGEVRVGLFIFKKVKGKWAFTRALVED